jgi:uridine phosphorylase
MQFNETFMQRIAESELIINERGAVYHLDIHPEELAPTVITVGDPARVAEVCKYFDRIEHKNAHREFVSQTGYIGQQRFTVLSSGIGPDNIDIVMNELDALVNIDFNSRTIRSELQSLQIVRMGTSGSLQGDIPVDSLVASTHGLGIDNLLNFYKMQQNDEEQQLLQSFMTQTQMHQNISQPYIYGASPRLLKKFVPEYHHGITVTCPGFYGPQGRVLRLGLSNPNLVNRLTDFRFGNHRITNFEMETSAIYGLGKLLGHHCLSVNVIVANRVARQFSSDSKKAIDRLIIRSLELLTAS